MCGLLEFTMKKYKAIILAAATLLSTSVYALDKGAIAPDFSLPELQSATTHQLSQYQGKVVYLDFWASWCAPCRISFPLLEKLYQDYKDQDFVIVAINMDEEQDRAETFLIHYPASFEILRDAEAKWAETYGVETMPTSFIIDKKGVVREIHHGFAKADIIEIEHTVKQLLAEPL